MTDFQILRNEIQIFRNEIQARRNKFQIRRNEIQIQNSSLPFLELSLFNDLRPSTHGAWAQMGDRHVSGGRSGHPRDFRRRGPTQNVRTIRRSFVLSIVASDCCDMTARMAGTSPATTEWMSPETRHDYDIRPRRFRRFLRSFSGSSDLSKASEVLAPFYDRGRLAPLPPDSVSRGASSRKRESSTSTDPRVMSPGTGTVDRAKKTGRSIRRPAEIRPLEKSPNRFRAWPRGRAPALPAVEYLTNPRLAYPFGFAIARRMRPLAVGRVPSAFHPTTESP